MAALRAAGPAPLALAALRDQAAHCRECPLGARATQTVGGEGSPRARLMRVAEQPGDREDLAGRSFIGPAVHLLDQALLAPGWGREQLYVTNAVKHFKYESRGKRRRHKTPGQLEMLARAHWLESEIATVAPRAVVALGGSAARALLGRPVKALSERGQWLARKDGVRVLVTVHPSSLLRGDPAAREQAFVRRVQDLSQASSALGAPESGVHRVSASSQAPSASHATRRKTIAPRDAAA